MTTAATYKPQLDALRALAVSGVLIHHFLPAASIIPQEFFNLGTLAVRFFFVLSGYLITGILLSNKMPVPAALTRFYLRRTLRIFPIYYLTLLVLIAADVGPVREFAWWHAFYLSNVLYTIDPGAAGPTVHLWTLAVEEQFYLFWPLLILLTPHRYASTLVVCTIAASVLWKAGMAVTLWVDPIGASFLTPGCLDSLAMGALLAAVEHGNAERRESFLSSALVLGAWLVLIQSIMYLTGHGGLFFAASAHLGISLMSVWLVGNAAQGFRGKLGILLEWKPLLFLGKISYGVYLYHYFMPDFIRYLARSLGVAQPGIGALFFLASTLTILVATASWFLIEKPISRFRPGPKH